MGCVSAQPGAWCARPKLSRGGSVMKKLSKSATASGYQFNDSHIHLTNYVQEGPNIREYLKMVGTTIKRSVLFGLPLQQTWSYWESGDSPPAYYMQADAPLYYYSFTDAQIAMSY